MTSETKMPRSLPSRMPKNLCEVAKATHSDQERSEGEESPSGNPYLIGARFLVVRQ